MDDRKNEILDVTRRLINEKGLINISTNDIARTVGISRGTLYHHFESKEAILDALVERVSQDIYNRSSKIANDKSIPVIQRMIETIMSLDISNGSNQIILEHLNSPNNILLHQKIQKEMIITLPTILSKIIEDGNQEGIFDTKYPHECMEMIIAYVSIVFDGDFIEMNKEEYMNKVFALIYNLERLLGAKRGTFSFVEEFLNYEKRV